MRISIYGQIGTNIAVLLFIRKPALLKSLFRISLIASLAFSLAFIVGEAHLTYSTEEQWMAIFLVGIIVMSTSCTGFAILLGLIDDNEPNTVVDIILTILSLPTTLGLWVTTICKKSTWILVGCTRAQYSIRATHLVRGFSYTTLALLSLTGLLSFMAILYFRCSTRENTTQKKICFYIGIVCWSLTSIFTIGTTEYIMRAAYYEENGTSIALRASTWGLGQIMAVITMASYIWEIANSCSERYHISLGNFSVRWMPCCCFHSRNTLPASRQDGGTENFQTDNVNTRRDDSGRNVDMRNAIQLSQMTNERQSEIQRTRTL